MSPISLGLLLVGAVLMGVGWTRAKGPWARLQALRAQDENVARYEKWRGGVRSNQPTGASVAMAMLRRQARIGFVVAGVGAGLVILGFFGRL